VHVEGGHDDEARELLATAGDPLLVRAGDAVEIAGAVFDFEPEDEP
jgi:hypothetical protein